MRCASVRSRAPAVSAKRSTNPGVLLLFFCFFPSSIILFYFYDEYLFVRFCLIVDLVYFCCGYIYIHISTTYMCVCVCFMLHVFLTFSFRRRLILDIFKLCSNKLSFVLTRSIQSSHRMVITTADIFRFRFFFATLSLILGLTLAFKHNHSSRYFFLSSSFMLCYH